MNWIYPVAITQEGGDFVVSVRDLPEVYTAGDSLEQAIALAEDAIAAIVEHRIDNGLDLSTPSLPQAGEHGVPLSAPMAAKASIYALWRAAGISKSELARRMAVADTEAHRVLNPRHATKLHQMAAAAKALGGTLVVGFST